MPSDFAFMSTRELRNGYISKTFSPVEVLTETVRRIEQLEPELNMFAHFDIEGAQAAAKASEKRFQKREPLDAVDGIPTSIKDLIAVKGMPLRFGSKAVSADPALLDAPSVERLRAAGAVILGKSTTSEFGCKAVGDSPLTGITRNPFDKNLTPGGSSCGAAAMVAAGIVPFAIGTDGGGSVRIPAALTGLYGIKAHFGRVPVFPTSATPTLAHVGPLARTAEDAAIALRTIAGYDKRDPFTVNGPRADYLEATRNSRTMKIAWSPTLGYGRADREVLEICDQALRRLQKHGFVIEQVDHVMYDPIDMWIAEFYAGVGTRLRNVIFDKPELIDPAVLAVLKDAIGQDLKDYYASVFARYDFREKMRKFFEEYDVLMSPTIPVAAFDVGLNVPPGYEDKNIVSWATYTYPFNLTGQPAASMPAGFTKSGLPVGLQVAASAHDETSILAIFGAYAEIAGQEIVRTPKIH